MSRADTGRLPVDSDPADTGASPRSVHLRPVFLAVVAAGGTLGTAAREGLTLVIPNLHGFPVPIFVINVVGAFLLGLLLNAVARRGPDTGRRRLLRLFAGTGFCGGFTTYSSLATTTAVALTAGNLSMAVLYGLGTVLIGAAASWAGILSSAVLVRARA